MDAGQVWNTLTEAQATIIAATITFLAAVGGVLLGWKLFSGKVRNIEDALQAAEGVLNGHIQKVHSILEEHEIQINLQLSAVAEKLGQVSGSIDDIQTVSNLEDSVQSNKREEMKDHWLRIRDKLEAIASDPAIDGRTRAKYGRIDRRRYGELINALECDGRLRDGKPYHQAVEMWHKYRNGRLEPSSVDMEAIRRLSGVLTE